ncbi:MAG: hypothetical protein HY897_06680 [Deltaproteobacteria bacterium]|nr:hypothetical protein [Deltaproteobacteria bacterium]
METRVFLAAVLVAAGVMAAAFAACSADDQEVAADGGGGGGDGGRSGGCTEIAQCSDFAPRRAVCIGGKCQALGGDQTTLVLNIGFTYAPEIKERVTSFAYYALHPSTVDGGTLTCVDLINGRDPEGTDLNLIQTYGKQLIVTGDMMQTGTLSLPYMEGLILFSRVFDDDNAIVGLACTPDVTVPSDNEYGVGVTLCPADKTERCLDLLPE